MWWSQLKAGLGASCALVSGVLGGPGRTQAVHPAQGFSLFNQEALLATAALDPHMRRWEPLAASQLPIAGVVVGVMRAGSSHPAGHVSHTSSEVWVIAVRAWAPAPSRDMATVWVGSVDLGILSWPVPGLGEVYPGPGVKRAHFGLFMVQPARHWSPSHSPCPSPKLPLPTSALLSVQGTPAFASPPRATHPNPERQL